MSGPGDFGLAKMMGMNKDLGTIQGSCLKILVSCEKLEAVGGVALALYFPSKTSLVPTSLIRKLSHVERNQDPLADIYQGALMKVTMFNTLYVMFAS